MMRGTGLIDMGYNGQHFTWCNNREGTERIRERLDRAIVNTEWIQKYPKAEVIHKLNIGSDHCPIVVQLEKQGVRTRKPFRFEKGWAENRECKEIVSEIWERDRGQRNRGGIHDRLGTCRHRLRRWNRANAVNNRIAIERIQQQLKTVQQAPNGSHSRERERQLKQKLEDLWTKEEEYWRTRSRIQWLKLGDRNSTYFHQATVERRRKNTINRMQRADGVWIENEADIVKECEDYFRNMFQSEACEGVDDQMHCIPKLVGEDDNRRLTRRVSLEEVKEAVFQLGGNKAPGPDGFPGTFYHRYWDTIGSDVFHSVEGFLNSGSLSPGFSYTDIILIPKIPNPVNTTQFRPISLCNFNYKIIFQDTGQSTKTFIA